ncbi:MAG: MaoC family dehydratase [Myxococcales bacterium]|nr:MaoC family dehydratase [Myxococcales bacterium]
MSVQKLKTLRFGEVKVGDRLAPLAVPITTTLVVAGAIASRDYQDVHHDKGAARRQGMQDVFMNILTTNGLVGRFVTDWAGPEAIIENVAIKLGAPNFPGDTMKMSGEVKSAETRGGRGVVTVEVLGGNAYGAHVTGTVRLTLPLE